MILDCSITRNRGHFEPMSNCQQCIMLHSRPIKSNVAALIALSERNKRKRVCYDVLQGLSTVYILYAKNRKRKRSQVKYMGFYVSVFFSSRKNFRHLNFGLILQTLFFPLKFTVKPSLYYWLGGLEPNFYSDKLFKQQTKWRLERSFCRVFLSFLRPKYSTWTCCMEMGKWEI